MHLRLLAAAAALLCATASQAASLAASVGLTRQDAPLEPARLELLQDLRELAPALAPTEALQLERRARLAASTAEIDGLRRLAVEQAGSTLGLQLPDRPAWDARGAGLRARASTGSQISRGLWMSSPDSRSAGP